GDGREHVGVQLVVEPEDLAIEADPRIVLLRALIHRRRLRAVRGEGRRGPRRGRGLLGDGGPPPERRRDQQARKHPMWTHRTSPRHSDLPASPPVSVLCTSLPSRRSSRTADSVNAIASPDLSSSCSPPSWREM